jgi:hypothetical protein
MEEHGWVPADESLLRSKLESKEAEIINDSSLEILRKKSDTSGINEDIARAKRAAKGDRRLDTSSGEQAHANQLTDLLTWIVTGLGVIVLLGGLAVSVIFGSSIIW